MLKKKYEQVFIRHLNDSLGSSEETRGWLEFSNYITKDKFQELDDRYDGISAMLYTLINKWANFSL
ncbi:MAG: four helix bundle protein [Elusimicrobiales bacterium]|nr:four helix bundle protein [Elusimicrobiales bacterium]